MNKRLSRVQTLLKEKSLDAILISSVPNIIYLTNYAGFSIHEREAYLLIAKTRNYLFTDGRYITAVKDLPDCTVIEIAVNNSLTTILKNIVKKDRLRVVGFEGNNITVNECKLLKKCFPKFFPTHLRDLRLIKQQDEIIAIKNACALGDKTFDYILGEIKPGLSEKDIALLIEIFIKKNGGDLSFPSIVAFGKNSSVPHHQTSNQCLASSGQFVLLDFGVKLNNYCSDMTRTVFMGSADAESIKIYQVVFDAQQKVIEYLSKHLRGGRVLNTSKRKTPGRWRSNDFDSFQVEGIKAKEIDKVARDYIFSQGYPTIPHSLGHGTGIEVHEAPAISLNSKDMIKPGMVFSIEPGIYLPNNIGVRIEDLFAIEKNTLLPLTNAPKELIEL